MFLNLYNACMGHHSSTTDVEEWLFVIESASSVILDIFNRGSSCLCSGQATQSEGPKRTTMDPR